MIAHSGPALEWQLSTLGVDWYIDYGADPSTAPPGRHKVPYIHIAPGATGVSATTAAAYSSSNPGSYWYLGGEPNRHLGENGYNGGAYFLAFADQFDSYVSAIKAADPTAKIIGPSILNWDWKCDGCAASGECASGGFVCGSYWMEQFFQAYADTHLGALPPIDVYAMDIYPLTWTPGDQPMTNWEILTRQVSGYRDWLNTHGLTGKPIWITEVASHWAYDSWKFDGEGGITIGDKPDGTPLDWTADYRWDAMSGYMTGLFGWLRANAGAENIGKWFIFITYTDIQQQVKSDGYAGIYLFQSGDPGAPLNPLGALYHDLAMGLQ